MRGALLYGIENSKSGELIVTKQRAPGVVLGLRTPRQVNDGIRLGLSDECVGYAMVYQVERARMRIDIGEHVVSRGRRCARHVSPDES
jgi:hypothetical protein